jgi:tetratricopeptide (TPR) repeat protein
MVLPLLAPCSCRNTSEAYASAFKPFSKARGRIVEVEGLQTRSTKYLQEGLAVAVAEPGCRVTMDFEGQTATVEAVPGSVLVFSAGGDILLTPLRPPPNSTVLGKYGVAPPPSGDGQEGAETGPNGTHTLASGTPPARETAPKSDAAPAAGSPSNSLAAPSPEAPPATNAASAAKAHDEARSLADKGALEAARQAYERAYALNEKDGAVSEGLVSLLKKMGLELYSKGKLEEAVTHWKRALQIRPEDEEVRRYLQRAQTVSGKL